MNNSATQSAGLSENVAGTLSYVLGLISGVIFLVVAPYNTNRTIRFNAFQSVFMAVGVGGVAIALSVFSMIMPAFVALMLGFLSMGVMLAYVGVWLFTMWKTYQGGTVVLPVVGPLAQQYANR